MDSSFGRASNIRPTMFPANGRRAGRPLERNDLFDQNVAAARKAITETKDEDMGQPWTLSQAGQVIFTMSRSAVVRETVLNHLIHHRAQLCVYLRLNDVPVPGMYGPSGD